MASERTSSPLDARKLLAALVLVALAIGYRQFVATPAEGDTDPNAGGVETVGGTQVAVGDDAGAILWAAGEGTSNLWVEAAGTVQRVLSDDQEEPRHQRFILELSNGDTVLIAHNIELAERLPVREGDAVTFRGEYEWNDRCGVVHWTHHGPQGRHEGGWLRHDGTVYEESNPREEWILRAGCPARARIPTRVSEEEKGVGGTPSHNPLRCFTQAEVAFLTPLAATVTSCRFSRRVPPAGA